jgi:hypothetical protein
MAIQPGTRLGPYEILSAIGADAGLVAQPFLAVRIAVPVHDQAAQARPGRVPMLPDWPLLERLGLF